MAASVIAPAAAAVEREIERTNAQFVAALSRGDAAAVALLYTANAVALPPNMPLMRGRQAIQELWGGLCNIGRVTATLTSVDVKILGDAAREIGAFTLWIEPPSGAPVQDAGKYVVLWEREDGAWKLAVDIWNSDLPAPGT